MPDIVDDDIGIMGLWLKFMCLLLLMIQIPIGWQIMIHSFHSVPVAFKCEPEDPLLYEQAKGAFTISDSNVRVSSKDFPSSCPINQGCKRIDFDHSTYKETAVMTFELVCNKEWLVNLPQTAFYFGMLAGSMLFGEISDRYGRKKPLLLSNVTHIMSGVLCSFVDRYDLFVISRLAVGIAVGGVNLIHFVLLMELVSSRCRETLSILYQFTFVVGYFFLPGMAYVDTRWRYMMRNISLTPVLLVVFYCFIPESPRWLFSMGNIESGVKILQLIARRNGLPTSHITKERYAQFISESATSQKGSIWDILKTPNMRKKTICLCVNWFAIGLSFFGASQYLSTLGGNLFTNIMISSGIVAVGLVPALLTLPRVGRRKIIFFGNLVTGSSLISIAFVPDEDYLKWIKALFSGCANLGVFFVFVTINLYSSELYPTVVRNKGLALVSIMSRIGSMISPAVGAVKPIWLPPLLLGTAPILAMWLIMTLPETKGFSLPNTMEEGEEFGKKKENSVRTEHV